MSRPKLIFVLTYRGYIIGTFIFLTLFSNKSLKNSLEQLNQSQKTQFDSRGDGGDRVMNFLNLQDLQRTQYLRMDFYFFYWVINQLKK